MFKPSKSHVTIMLACAGLLLLGQGASWLNARPKPTPHPIPFSEKKIDVEVAIGDMFHKRGTLAWVNDDIVIFEGVNPADTTVKDNIWLYAVRAADGKVSKVNLDLPLLEKSTGQLSPYSYHYRSVWKSKILLNQSGLHVCAQPYEQGAGRYYTAAPSGTGNATLVPISSKTFVQKCGNSFDSDLFWKDDTAFNEWITLEKKLGGKYYGKVFFPLLTVVKLQDKSGYLYLGRDPEVSYADFKAGLLEGWRGAFFDKEHNDNVHWIKSSGETEDLGFSIRAGGRHYAEFFPFANAYVVVDGYFAFAGNQDFSKTGTTRPANPLPGYVPYYVWTPGSPVKRFRINDPDWAVATNDKILLTRGGHILIGASEKTLETWISPKGHVHLQKRRGPESGVAWIDPKGHVHLLVQGGAVAFGVSPNGCKLAVGMRHPSTAPRKQKYSSTLHILDFCSNNQKEGSVLIRD